MAEEEKRDSNPPKHGRDYKGLAALVTAAAALIAACGALFKPQDHTVTKTAYDTLSESIQKLSDENRRNHEDLVSIRGYLDGVTRSPLPTWTTFSVDAGVAATGSSAPAPMPFIGPPVSTTAAPPRLHPDPTPVKPPSFGDVERKAKL